MLDHCKSIATRAKLDPAKFDLKTFRSTYATGMLRKGFGVRTVQHWMGHKSLETTMRYLAPATDVRDELDLVTIPCFGKADPALRKSAARETRSPRHAPPESRNAYYEASSAAPDNMVLKPQRVPLRDCEAKDSAS
jgi:hypothetical protein